jgi:hypothetical protein
MIAEWQRLPPNGNHSTYNKGNKNRYTFGLKTYNICHNKWQYFD